VFSLRFRAVFGAALLIAGTVGATACGSGFLDGLTGGTDGGPAQPPDTVTPVNIGCVGVVPPDGSTGPDGPSKPTLSFAFETVRLTANLSTDSGAPPPVGFNLDHLCTCGEDKTPSCVLPDAGTTASAPICDGDGGTDDALASFFNLLASAIVEFRQDFAGERIRSGLFTVLIEVDNWNGQPEDPQVLVRIRMSSGFDRTANGGRKKPNFDGTDIWEVDPSSIVDGTLNVGKDCRSPGTGGVAICTATIADGHAFVTGGHLIAHPTNTTLTTPIVIQSSVGRITVDLTNTILDAVLTETDGGLWKMTGEFDGRWPVGSVLNTIANIQNPFDPTGGAICESAGSAPSTYSTLKAGVCAGLDLAASPSLDSNPLTPCTSVSSALSFVASTATAGTIVLNTPNSTNCVDWKDDCTH